MSALQPPPELSGRSGALHEAVIAREPELVRVLMAHGANARIGIYPHRDATSALTLAMERGDDEIVAIIRDEERRRQQASSGVGSVTDELFAAVWNGHGDRVRALITTDPALVRARHPVFDWTPLHVAARTLDAPLVEWLVDRGADVSVRAGRDEMTPLDVAADRAGHNVDERSRVREAFPTVARLLLSRGASMEARAAVALGDADWLRARQADGRLINPITETGGLLRIAVSHDRPDMLRVLLACGCDPDERTRMRDVDGSDVVWTWGMPLWECAASGRHEMAELLLSHGADPNADVYASGTPVHQAYGQGDERMIELLTRFGGVPEASTAGLYRRPDLARKFLSGDAPYRIAGDGGETLAERLLWGAACGGSPEIVRLALAQIDWRRDDPRWFHMLEQPLRIWNHGSGGWSKPEWDRTTYQTCFRMILEHCDPNIRGRLTGGPRFGLTILHSVAGSREHMTADERVAFATMLLDTGARLDLRDEMLESTPLGWACRWGRLELVTLYLQRGADPTEVDAKPWATPLAWARKKQHAAIEAALVKAGAS